MRIQLVSDLHLEFCPITLENAGADVLVLAGDICVGKYFTKSEASPYYEVAQNFLTFFEDVSNKFKNVIYVKGNHEFYHGDIDEVDGIISNALKHLDNIHILSSSYVDIDGYRFVGDTLWTDCGNFNPISEMIVNRGINDFRLIKKTKPQYRKFLVNDMRILHKEQLKNFEELMNDKTILVTHHAMSEKSVHPRFSGDKLNDAYYSDLDDWILRHKPLVHIHGHVHDTFKYAIGDTRVFTNPRGYERVIGMPENRVFDPSFIIDMAEIGMETN